MQLPRPKWTKRKFINSASGVWLGRASIAWNAILIVRELWYRFCEPGTFRALLRNLWTTLTTGERFQWPSALVDYTNSAHLSSTTAAVVADSLRWYVTTADLQTFKDAVEDGNGPVWERMLHKEWDSCSYTAYRRSLPNGRTEYKSITLSENATAQEFMDFYLDDDVRPKWDGMISEHQLLESAHDQSHRCQVVRWVRSFPFAFLSRREYVIARRAFPGPDPSTMYGITKSVEHPAAPPVPGMLRMSTFYSMWCSKTVPCRHGSSQPMCETTLLHFEDFGIPEHLARFAVRHGMPSFVIKMVPHIQEFVQERRTRCGPFKSDDSAYGAHLTPVMRSGGSITPCEEPGTPTATRESLSLSTTPPSSSSNNKMLRSSSVRGFGYMLLASGVAIALSRSGSSQALVNSNSAAAAPPSSSQQVSGGEQQQRQKHHKKHSAPGGASTVAAAAAAHHHSTQRHAGKKRHSSSSNHHPYVAWRQHHHHGSKHRSSSTGSGSTGLRSHRVAQGDAEA